VIILHAYLDGGISQLPILISMHIWISTHNTTVSRASSNSNRRELRSNRRGNSTDSRGSSRGRIRGRRWRRRRRVWSTTRRSTCCHWFGRCWLRSTDRHFGTGRHISWSTRRWASSGRFHQTLVRRPRNLDRPEMGPRLRSGERWPRRGPRLPESII